MTVTYLTGTRYPSSALKRFLPEYLEILLHRGESLLTTNKKAWMRSSAGTVTSTLCPFMLSSSPATAVTISETAVSKPNLKRCRCSG